MKHNFWKSDKPLILLAPMANVTDEAFRRIIAKYSKPNGPDAMWTEFVSTDGLCSEGRERLLPDLWYSESERPIVAQFFGANPEYFYRTAELAREMGFDGIDINMGCPDRGVERQGAGAGLIKTPDLAGDIIKATKRGAGNLPVSVKTRLGYAKNELESWLPRLLDEGPEAVIIHARTRKEMSKVPARWEDIAKAVEIRDKYGSEAKIIGNGDISDIKEAEEKIKMSGAHGAMIGRGIFGNPWFFKGYTPSIKERIEVMVEHTKLFEELFGDIKNFAVMKKHYKAYANDFPGAKELRIKLMATRNVEDVERVATDFLKNIG